MNFLSVFVITLAALHQTSNVEAITNDQKWAQFLSAFPSTSVATVVERNMRKNLFLAVDAAIERHNADPKQTFKMAHNEFSAMTAKEKQQFLGKKPKSSRSIEFKAAPEFDERALPTSYDLRTATACGKKIPGKTQGSCGSCWAFSAIAPIEYSQCVKSGGNYTVLSEQQLISCDTTDSGCDGGDPAWTFDWLTSKKKNTGVVATSASYPYTSSGTTGTCKTSGTTTGATLKKWSLLQCAAIGGTGYVTTAIINAIYTYGTVANCVLANSGSFYNYK